jgi:hypothetical protein
LGIKAIPKKRCGVCLFCAPHGNVEMIISDALRFGRLWYGEPDDAIGYAKFFSRSHNAVIRVYDEAGNA